jgi:hypothetical protein
LSSARQAQVRIRELLFKLITFVLFALFNSLERAGGGPHQCCPSPTLTLNKETQKTIKSFGCSSDKTDRIQSSINSFTSSNLANRLPLPIPHTHHTPPISFIPSIKFLDLWARCDTTRSVDYTVQAKPEQHPQTVQYLYRVLQKSDSVWKTGLSPQTCSKPAENRVFDRKTCRNELKTWFLLDQLVNEGLDKRCKPGLSTKTYQKPALTATNLVYQHENSRNSTKPGFSVGLRSVYLRF